MNLICISNNSMKIRALNWDAKSQWTPEKNELSLINPSHRSTDTWHHEYALLSTAVAPHGDKCRIKPDMVFVRNHSWLSSDRLVPNCDYFTHYIEHSVATTRQNVGDGTGKQFFMSYRRSVQKVACFTVFYETRNSTVALSTFRCRSLYHFVPTYRHFRLRKF